MNSDIFERIAIYCDRNQLFQAGDGVIAGLSGGADSVFLLWVLVQLQKKWDLRLQAVHINHGIRGEEALRDQNYAVSFAERLGIACKVYQADIPALSKEWQMTEEEAGRTYRYQCFEALRKELRYNKIAVAHHRDDQAETILFQLLRGSSLRGLGGMRPKRGRIVRPLLEVGRQEIEKALQEEEIDYCTDSTNGQDVYARNLIRNHVMPYLQQNIQPAAVRHIASAGSHLREVMDYIDSQTDEAYQRLVGREQEGLVIYETSFLNLPAVIQKEVILKMIEELSGKRKDITSAHVELVLSVVRGKTGRRIMLPYGLCAEKSYERLFMYRQKNQEKERGEYFDTGKIHLEKEYRIPLGKEGYCKVDFEKSPVENLSEFHLKKHCTKCFDYDKMVSMPAFRYPEEGDFLWLDSSGKTKKLSRFFIDEKIPLRERRRIVVLAEEHHILWIPLLNRCSAYYYVSEDTKEVIRANIRKD